MSTGVVAGCSSGHKIPVITRANFCHRQNVSASRHTTPRATQRHMVLAQSSADNSQKAVWALDFDGVVCNSVGESSLTAWKAAEQQWPDVFKSEQAKAKKDQVLKDMEHVRPVIETGYENLIQVRCLLEGISTVDILNDWHRLLPEYMDKWKQSRKELVELFGSVRDAWIAEDLHSWLDANGIYPGLPEDLSAAQKDHELYIVTTKQASAS